VASRLNRRRRRGPRLYAIELHHVSVRLGRHWALREASLTIRAGERWLVTGPNGSGKTVLLRLLRGELWPTPTGPERRVYRLGRSRDEQPLAAKARIAYLGPERQDKYDRHVWDLGVREVVATGLFDTDIPLDRVDARDRRAVDDALRAVGLLGLAERRFLGLSTGQRRRVLLARALVGRPDVLLLDEALNSLDAAARRSFLRHLRHAVDPTTAWVLTTHRADEAPSEVTHRARLEAGRIVESGPRLSPRGSAIPLTRPRERFGGVVTDGEACDVAVGTSDLVRLRDASVYRDYRPVISRLSWTLRRGEHWCIAGPNGSGKSTLLALLYGDLWPALGGSIERPSLPPGMPISEWKRQVGLVSAELQTTYAATACTVEEIVLSGLHSSIGLNARPSSRERSTARRALSHCGLLPLRARRARELSYGQLRLALFARATLLPRRLLLLDELFDGLDPQTSDRLHVELERLVRSGAQVVLATHHRQDVPDYVRNVLELGRDGRARISVRAAAAGRDRAGDGRRVRPRSASR
jgi:molybdate transport system ATP-binding protein